MVNVLVLFGHPVDSNEFDTYFIDSHCPLLREVPGVEKMVFNQIAGAAQGESPYYLIVDLRFASEEAMQEGLNSEAGQAMATDFSQFASGGVTVLFAQSSEEILGASERVTNNNP